MTFDQPQLFLLFGLAGRQIGLHAVAAQACLQRGAFDRFQRAAGVVEAQAQRCDADGAAHMHGFFFAHREGVGGQPLADLQRLLFQAGFGHVDGQQQEAVVVQARQRVGLGGAGQAVPGLGHQALVGGIAVTLAQAERAGDLDEEQAAGLLALQRVGEQVHHVAAGGQAGFRIAAHADLFAGLLQRLLACAADAVGHRSDQVARADRLGEEVVGAAVEHFELALRVRVAGQEHDRQQLLTGLLADQRGQADAVQLGHVQIHQDQIRVIVLDRLRHAGGGHLDLRMHPGAVQHALREQGLRAVVFDDEDAVRRIGGDIVLAIVRRGGRCRCG